MDVIYNKNNLKQCGNAFICKIEIVNKNIQFQKSPQNIFRMKLRKN